MYALILLLALLVFLFLFAPKGRRGDPKLDALRGWSYAHRGLHDAEKPENSLSAFRSALEHGYGIELDVHLLKDGTLAVLHDSSLVRMTGREGMIEDLTTDALCDYPLAGTKETIPTFAQVLSLFDGKAPMIVELKCANGNHAELVEKTCALLRDYHGAWCMESFDPRCVYYLKRHHSDIVRGQLTQNYFAENPSLSFPIRFLLTHNLLNWLTKPDFVAYRFPDRRATPTYAIWKKLWGIQGVAWTLRTQEEYAQARSEGMLPIFEGFLPDKN